MKKLSVCGLVIGCVIGGTVFPCGAHPHVFIDCGLTLLFDDHGLAGLQQRWLLDEMFTAFLLGDFDLNANKEFEPEEVAAVKAGAFDNLREYQYFTHVLADGEALTIQEEATTFGVELAEDGRAIYSFFIPCPINIETTPRQVLIAIFDDTYYCDVALVKDAISAKNHAAFTLAPAIKDLPEFTYYYNQIIPKGLFATVSKKP